MSALTSIDPSTLSRLIGALAKANLVTRERSVAASRENIRVNCVCPVAGDTPLLGQSLIEDTPEARAKVIASIPVGRLATPADVANACLWLASDEAAFVTGAALAVDGGRCL